MHNIIARFSLACLLCLALLTACKKDEPPAPEQLAESCENLASQYLKCISGPQPDEAAITSLHAKVTQKCTENLAKHDSAKALIACTNSPCDKMEECLKTAQEAFDKASTPPATAPTPPPP